jgi:hypothetical protein
MGVVASGLSATPSKYRGKYRGAMSIAGSPKYFLDDLSVGAIRAELLDGFEIRRYVGSVSGLKFWGDQLFAWPSLAQRGHHSHVSPNTPIFGVLLRPIPECLHHCTIAPLRHWVIVPVQIDIWRGASQIRILRKLGGRRLHAVSLEMVQPDTL